MFKSHRPNQHRTNQHRTGATALAAGAVLALAALIAAPAHALPRGPIDDVVLQTASGAQPYGDYAMSAVSVGPVSADVGGVTLDCDWATGSGTFHSTAYANPYLEFDSIDISSCQTLTPPLTVDVSLNPGCHLTVDADLLGNINGSPVPGTLHASDPPTGDPCVHAAAALQACTMDIGGDVEATFDEATQQLSVDGAGLTIQAATGLCSFLASEPITLNVDFDISAVDHMSNPGDINFRG